MRLHHIGLVVSDLETQIERLRDLLGAELLGETMEDPLQGVKIAFVSTGADVTIELLQPTSDASPVARFLQEGGGLNHLCYSVPDLDAALGELRAKGCLVVSPPKPAVALSGRRVSFLYTRDRQLIELVEG